MKTVRTFLWLTQRWLRIPLGRQLMYGEAVIRLVGAWILIRWVPYKFWRSLLGKPRRLVHASQLNAGQTEIAQSIASLHQILQRIFGLRFTCLMLALSARGMLKARNVESVLVLGVNHNANTSDQTTLGAHAWVKSGNVDIIGHESDERFTPVALYAD
jgi:Transglutaminase-like superfamily